MGLIYLLFLIYREVCFELLKQCVRVEMAGSGDLEWCVCWNGRERWSGMTRNVEQHLIRIHGQCSVRRAWVPALVTGRRSECSVATWLCLPVCGSCHISTWPRTCSVQRITNSCCRLVRKLQSSRRVVTLLGSKMAAVQNLFVSYL